MKTDICTISSDKSTFSAIFAEVDKSAEYNKLPKKQALQLRLLAEELVGMLPELLEIGSGKFWIENDGKDFELHASVKAENLSMDNKEDILAISKSGENAASKGIINKIRLVAENMLDLMSEGYIDTSGLASDTEYYDFYNMGATMSHVYNDAWQSAWSLSSYKQYAGDNRDTEAWDELEKSIIANLADDVIVGVIGKKVDIIIKKKFD